MGTRTHRLIPTRALAAGASITLMITMTAVGPARATHPDHGGTNHRPTTTCDVYRTAVRWATISKPRRGSLVTDLTAGAPKGHQGWLTWDGAMDDPSLVASLTPPGNSSAYRNPDQ